MKSKKAFNAPAPVAVATVPPALDGVASLVIDLPENPSTVRTIDLNPWLGKGIDPWVWACAGQLRAFLASKAVTPNTVAGYWRSGLRYFFEFLVATGSKVAPQTLEPGHIQQFVGWLKDRGGKYGAQKGRYTATKAVLAALVRRGVVPDHEDLFPANPFPGSNRRAKGATPLTAGERDRLALALRDDIVAIHKGTFDGRDSAALVVYLLALAIRTGANPTPLLEASRDCLRPHPFMPNMMLLSLFKRRGNATKLMSLRFSREDEGSLAVPMDGVALLRKVLKLTEPLLAEATPQHRDRVWLYRPERSAKAGQVCVTTKATLDLGIALLIVRNDLRGDDGEPLRLNLSRLRKTVEQRYWALSGGDLIATAALMGHAPKVADSHYLACTHQMRENATFVGEALPDIYRAGAVEQKVIPILPGKSPTGRCKDPYNGDKAPKNGEPCDDFFSCFACSSYAIVGSPDDLHRLFSFYGFLEREMNHARSNDWREEFRHTINLIDRFTADKFDAELVVAAKERARIEPLKFWASYTLSSPEVVNG
jgi:hypothetical protein